MAANDKATDYFNFQPGHENILIHLGKEYPIQHRLGTFQAVGQGKRIYDPQYPKLLLIHVPVMDGKKAALRVAQYLSNPLSNMPGSPYATKDAKGNQIFIDSSVHQSADTEEYYLCMPADTECYGCGNQNTRHTSYEIEIAGWGPYPTNIAGSTIQDASYWKNSSEAHAKLTQACRGYIKSLWLSFDDKWKYALVPLVKAELNLDGSMKSPGCLMHRDVPYWDYAGNTGWKQPPIDNIKGGQHGDICEDFPWDTFFQIYATEINRASSGAIG